MPPHTMKIQSPNTQAINLAAPRYWLLWLLFAMAYPVTRLPLAIQHRIGRGMGRLLYYFGPRRRHIAAVNLSLCFPDMTEQERKQLLKKNFDLYGTSLIEIFAAWWSKPAIFHNKVTYEGLEHLTTALKKNKGVLLLSGHFTTIEIGQRLLGQKIPFNMVYRPHKNPLIEYIMSSGRQRWTGKAIDRLDIREMLRTLKSNYPLAYAPDQDYGRKHSVFVPFMGIMAATITATAKLAKLSGAPTIFYVVRRTNNDGYHVKIFPGLTDFPSEDQQQNAIRINNWFEERIREVPADYLWTHRRFKTPPPGKNRPY
jgi:KDO2-lipid IV(A) lauroyltransferase